MLMKLIKILASIFIFCILCFGILNITNMKLFSGFSSPKISILRLNGIIGDYGESRGLSMNSMNKHIEQAFSLTGLKAVFLVINSPGGCPVQSDLLSKRIICLSKEKSVPVYSFIDSIGASGGYWLACCGEKIFCSNNSIIGSIGVISKSFGLENAIKKLGIERRIYSQGKNKAILDPFSPAKESDANMIKHIQKEIHTNFIEYVKSRRPALNSKQEKGQNDKFIDKDSDDIFDGSVWVGSEAKKIGLVDDIKDVYLFKKENFPKNTIFKHITKKEHWIKKKLGIEFGALSYIMDSLLYENKL